MNKICLQVCSCARNSTPCPSINPTNCILIDNSKGRFLENMEKYDNEDEDGWKIKEQMTWHRKEKI